MNKTVLFAPLLALLIVASSSASSVLAMDKGDFNLSNKFSLEIDGVTIAGVHTIEGLETESDIVEYKDGEDGTNHTRPGNHKPGKITIIKDFSPNDKTFFNWRQSVIDGRTQRKSVSIVFLNDNDVESTRINLFDCYPTKWKGPNLNSKNSGHATEKIEIVCETIDWK